MGKPGTIILFIIISIIILIALIGASHHQTDQPIQYNHKVHVEEADMGCLDCHQNAEVLTRAMIPNISICGDCHDDVESENMEERKVAEYVSNGIIIPWIQIHIVPDHVYFSHRRHVTLAGIDCINCHGDVAKMEKPFSIAFVNIEMEWCMTCHEEQEVSNECSGCHR